MLPEMGGALGDEAGGGQPTIEGVARGMAIAVVLFEAERGARLVRADDDGWWCVVGLAARHEGALVNERPCGSVRCVCGRAVGAASSERVWSVRRVLVRVARLCVPAGSSSREMRGGNERCEVSGQAGKGQARR